MRECMSVPCGVQRECMRRERHVSRDRIPRGRVFLQRVYMPCWESMKNRGCMPSGVGSDSCHYLAGPCIYLVDSQVWYFLFLFLFFD